MISMNALRISSQARSNRHTSSTLSRSPDTGISIRSPTSISMPLPVMRCQRSGCVNLAHPLRWHRITGRGIDMDAGDLMDMPVSGLRDKVELVCRFDRACDDIRSAFIEIIDNCKVVEEVVMIPRTVKRIECCRAS